MRELLDRQLALFQELESRRTILDGQRQHLLEQLRTVAIHLAQLRAARLSSIDNPAATTTIENICGPCCLPDPRLIPDAVVPPSIVYTTSVPRIPD